MAGVLDRELAALKLRRRTVITPTCWLWVGAVSAGTGYGSMVVRNYKTSPHRAAWIVANGEIPAGMLVCHHCDVRLCCNPAHLFLGTNKDNAEDRGRKGRTRTGTTRGEAHPRAKLTESAVRSILERQGQVSQASMASEYGVSTHSVYRVISGKTWAHIARER